MEFLVLFVVVLMSLSSSREALIFRSSCRRDTLMKLTDREKKLTGIAQDIISENRVAAARYCVRLCAKENSCASVNFKITQSAEKETNCQLLKITRLKGQGTLTGASGWRHYEPVSQPGPRCRSFPCSSGYECIEQCQTLQGYECVDINECASNPCKNGGTCSNQINKYTCTCTADYLGTNCEQVKRTSCKDIKDATGTSQNGVYQLWDSTLSIQYSAYCDMAYGGWTLIARFSNADAKNWIATSGSYWYDQTAVGSTTSPSANSDMINKGFYNAKGTDIKLTRSDSTSHNYLLYANGCLSSTTFRSKITSYGNFRNGARWSSGNQCLGQCSVNSYWSVSGVSGFSQYNCNGDIQSAKQIGFWCHYESGDGAVIMIGGGGNSCARADHGIAITEEDGPRLGTTGPMDFGDNVAGSSSYALNLWIR